MGNPEWSILADIIPLLPIEPRVAVGSSLGSMFEVVILFSLFIVRLTMKVQIIEGLVVKLFILLH